MHQSSKHLITDPLNWEQFIGQIPQSKQSLTSLIDLSSPKFIHSTYIQPRLIEFEPDHKKQNFKSPSQTLDPFQHFYDENSIKNEEENFSEDQFPENTFKRPQLKASLYSKNYREKKKEKVKKLQEENDFLKKKVNELQVRLREKELELSRIKYSLTQEEWTIQQMNEEMIKKLTLISDVTIEDTSIMKEEKRNEETENEKKIEEFLKFYEDHGFVGKKKKQVLQYYVNQFLQNVMRDREKYLIVTCIKKKYLISQMKLFDEQIAEVLMNNTEENRQKSIKFNEFIRPACLELVQGCRNFYSSYQNLLKKIQRIHEETKILSMKNIQETMKRSRGAAWFQANQYRKQMRSLRAEWINLVKSEHEIEAHQNKAQSKSIQKRKKLPNK